MGGKPGRADRHHPVGTPGSRALPRRALLAGLGLTALAGAGWVREGGGEEWPARPGGAYPGDVATSWFDHALDLVRTTPRFSPPVGARALGYAGIALYEAIVPGMPRHRSLATQLKDFQPPPPAGAHAYHWPTVASTAVAALLRHLVPTAPAATRARGLALEVGHLAEFRSATPPAVFVRSIERGIAVADHVFAWSKTDGGHEGDRRGPVPYTPPAGPGLWVPTPPRFQPALLPTWGQNRPFVLSAERECPAAPPAVYSTGGRSDFHAEVLRVYHTVNRLTPEQRAIALFWSDDPGQTVTPPGHCVSILTQVLRATAAPLDVAAEAYAKVGIAVTDAFIDCWRTKYRVNLLRPVTYIRSEIDPDWTPPLVTPPFPEHTSGHSVQSAAAAEVMTDLFGRVTFTDRTHESRGLPARAFASFWHAAREAAISRLYGGIHFLGAITAGLEQGRCIGRAVAALRTRM